MTQPASAMNIALYLGESYASAQLFSENVESKPKTKTTAKTVKKTTKKSASAVEFKKTVFLPQVSLKTLLGQIKTVSGETPIKSVYIVTSYMDRLKAFRLGGSVVQVVVDGFENSYSAGHTHYLSLAAPSLIVSVNAKTDIDDLKKELIRLRKINSEINKVVFELPESLISKDLKQTIHDFFTSENFKIFDCLDATDLNDIRRTLLNAGSEGTKDEIVSEITDAFGENTDIQFWVKDRFTKTFENIDLYFSSSYFLKNYLQTQQNKSAFYFDFEKWSYLSTETTQIWKSPWGPIRYEHPICENFEVDPFAELTLDSIGQLIVSENNVQHEPGPFIAGRSVKALILDCFYDELKNNDACVELFNQLSSKTLQQKIENHFQILEKSQTLEATQLSRDDVKNWIRAKIITWMQLKNSDIDCTVFGQLSFLLNLDTYFGQLRINNLDFNWTEAITASLSQGEL